MNEVQCREYLTRIGFDGEVTHTAKCLDELILAHLKTVPFENLDVSQDHKVPSLKEEDLFDKIVIRKRGGWCFELNKLFYELLKACGFDAIPIAVRIVWMKPELPPYLHRATVVRLNGKEYLCDVGYGGPGPKGLVELADGEYQIKHAQFRVQMHRPDTKGAIIIEKLHDGKYHEMLRFYNRETEDVDYSLMNLYCARADGAFFANRDVANLYREDGGNALMENELKLTRNGMVTVMECHNDEEKKEWLKQYFGIEK